MAAGVPKYYGLELPTFEPEGGVLCEPYQFRRAFEANPDMTSFVRAVRISGGDYDNLKDHLKRAEKEFKLFAWLAGAQVVGHEFGIVNAEEFPLDSGRPGMGYNERLIPKRDGYALVAEVDVIDPVDQDAEARKQKVNRALAWYPRLSVLKGCDLADPKGNDFMDGSNRKDESTHLWMTDIEPILTVHNKHFANMGLAAVQDWARSTAYTARTAGRCIA